MAAASSIIKDMEQLSVEAQRDPQKIKQFAEKHQDEMKILNVNAETLLEQGIEAVFKIARKCYAQMQIDKLEVAEKKLTSLIFNERSGTYIDLKKKVIALEKRKQKVNDLKRINRDKNEKEDFSPEEIEKRNLLFHEIANEYLATGKNFSALYKQTQDNPLIEGMEFEEFFDRIIEDLEKKSDGSIEMKNHIDKIKKIETENRVLYLLGEKMNLARRNIQMKTQNSEDERILSYGKEFRDDYARFHKSNQHSRKEAKSFLAQKRGLDVKNYKFKFNPKHTKEEKKEPYKEAISERNKVLKDRREIIKLSKELKISPDKAAKMYFRDKSRDFSHYTKKELKILLGNDDKNSVKSKISNNRVLNKLRKIFLDRNEKSIEEVTIALEQVNKKIEQESEGVYSSMELADSLRKAGELTSKLRKLEATKRRHERSRDGKNAFDIVNDKDRKNAQKEIFKMYSEDGKSVAEILKILEQNGNEHFFSFNQVLDAVVSGSKKYLTIQEINQMKKTETRIYLNSLRKDAAEIKLQNANERLEKTEEAKEKGKMNNGLIETESYTRDWQKVHLQKIKTLNERLSDDKTKTDGLREKINKRRKLFSKLPKTSKQKKAQEAENSQRLAEENRDANPQDIGSANQQQTQNMPPQQLNVEEIKTPHRMRFDLKKLVSERNVTTSSLKEAAKAIVNLKNEPDRESDLTNPPQLQQVADEDTRQ